MIRFSNACPKFGLRVSVFVFGVVVGLGGSVVAQPPDNNDPGTGVTIQLPILGVSIDAAGVLTTQAFADPTGQLMAARRNAAQRGLNKADLNKPSKLRKVSLKRLEAAVQELIEDGQKPTDAMLSLAGLQQLKYVFVMPDEGDIILAGPAEGWVTDLSGRRVGISTGEPTLLLDDLLAALRIFGPKSNPKTWVAVSIDPIAHGIANLNEFKKKIPSRIPSHQRAIVQQQVAEGLQDSLGMTNIAVYGAPRKTHLAQVMIEADYRMKLIAIGREPPPIKMTTFIGALQGEPKYMQRWWLSPNYQCVMESADKMNIELVGRGVQLSTENIMFGTRANIKKTKLKPSRAARSYANSFTSNYEDIAKASPVFAQLRNVIDVLVATAWICKHQHFQTSGWQPDVFLDESKLSVENLPDPKTAPATANAIWKGNLLVAPVGGGVSVMAADALTPDNLMSNKKSTINKVRKGLNLQANDNWWWD